MNRYEILTALVIFALISFTPWGFTVAVCFLLLVAVAGLTRFWIKNPSIWQMKRRARHANASTASHGSSAETEAGEQHAGQVSSEAASSAAPNEPSA